MNKFFVFIFTLCVSNLTVAAPTTSLRQEALKENQFLDKKAYKKTIQASEAQQANVSTFLKLQDPTPELRNRPWLWSFAFKLQSLQPLGSAQVTGLNFDLHSYGASVMPSLGFGFLLNPVAFKNFDWSTGLSAQTGYMSQKTNLVTPHGFTYEDTRLTTTLTSLSWAHRLKFQNLPEIQFSLNPEFGFVSYTQTHIESPTANFSKQNRFWGVGLGVEYALTRKWGLLAQYSYRTASAKDASTSNIQKNNLEIGTLVTW